MKYPELLIQSLGVFIFDQSSNHQAFKQNALLASRMTLNEKPAEKDKSERFRLGWYWKTIDGAPEKQWQVMYYIKRIGGPKGTREVIYFKGIKTVS